MTRALWLLCLSIALISAQQNAILIALPPLLVTHGMSPVTIGFICSLPPLFTLIARLPSGLINSSTWANRALVGTYLGLGASSLLFAYADQLWHVVVLSALSGFLVGVLTTLVLPLYLDALPGALSKAKAMGYYTGAVALGFAAGGYVAGYGADLLGFSFVFYVAAASTLIGLAPLLLERIETPITPPVAGDPGRSSLAVLPDIRAIGTGLLTPSVAFVLITSVCLNMLYKIPATYLPSYANSFGISLSDVGLLMGSYALCNAIVRPLCAPAVEAFGIWPATLLYLSAQALVVMLIGLEPSLWILLMVVFSAGTLRALVMVANAVAMTDALNTRFFTRGMASGLFNAAADVGYILGPILAGIAADAVGVRAMFVVAPAILGVGYSIAYFYLRRKQTESASSGAGTGFHH
jgi:MFS family permease